MREDSYDKPNIIIFKTEECDSMNFEISNDNIVTLIKYGYDITKEEMPDIIEYLEKNE